MRTPPMLGDWRLERRWGRGSVSALMLRGVLSFLTLVMAFSTDAHGQDAGPTPQSVAQQKLNPLAYGITFLPC